MSDSEKPQPAELEGKPAPAWKRPSGSGQAARVDGTGGPSGAAVLLAHWCSDCKAEVAVLAEIRKLYGPRGLVLIAPTRYYGMCGER